MSDDASTTPLGARALEHCAGVLRPVFEGRRFLLFGGPLASLAKTAKTLHGLGAASTFLLGDAEGTGDPPDPAWGPTACLGIEGRDVMEAFRKGERALLSLPATVQEAVDLWDPRREARALGYFSLAQVPEIAGRRRFAFRPEAWQALEDKVRVDAFWDAAGVRRAPFEIVPAEEGALRAAARRLGRGLGTAWAGDAREGVNGGAEYVRRVRGDDDAGEAVPFFAARCDSVRVMPFLEGIPCSMHGAVFPGGDVAVFRPVEMVTLRRAGTGRLLYAGCSTYFDPAPADREALRATARRVGEALRDRVGFRGGFTMDGVLAEEGWLPTELNPRPGAGHQQLAAGLPGFPMAPFLLAVQEGLELPWDARLIEEAIVEAADSRRAGVAQAVFRGTRRATEKGSLAADPGGALRRALEGEAAAASFEAGPGAAGPFVRIVPAPGTVAPGDSLGPFAVRAFAATDAFLGTGFGPLEPARRVR